MPYVRIEVTDEAVADGDKAEIIAGVTELLQRVLGKDPATTFVVIDEVPLANWGIGGVPVVEWRRRRRA
jgi:4-oxalocrotonate tautomerase